jgi:hypothetical protein
MKSRKSSLSICLLYLDSSLTNFNDSCVNIFSLIDLPSLFFAVPYKWYLQDSGHMDLRTESDATLTFYSNQDVYNYVNTSIQGFFTKIFKLLLSPKFY